MSKILAVIFFVVIIEHGLAQELDDDNLKTPYCFQFTWLGPDYNPYINDLSNVTCDNLTKGGKGIPCVEPLIATNDSEIPNTNLLWEQNKDDPLKIACKLSNVNVCVKYSYIYGSGVENITYMCGKVNIVNEYSEKNGCHRQHFDNGREIEVCACESIAGHVPCNYTNSIRGHLKIVIILILILGLVWRL